MRPLAAAALLPILAACTPQAQDQLARDAAKSVVSRTLIARYPDVPLEPALFCTIDNASAAQINALAVDSVTGPTASTAQIVADIVSKPETLTCLAANGLPALIR